MMRFIYALMICLTLFLLDCRDNGSAPQSGVPSGRTTLNSKLNNNHVSGFSFHCGGVVTYLDSTSILPDFIVLAQENLDSITGVFLAPSSYRPAFKLVYEGPSSDSAEIRFNNLSEAPTTRYTYLALDARPNQVWAVITQDTLYGKILIRHTLAFEDSSIRGAPTPYGEMTFDWAYQPDGSRFY